MLPKTMTIARIAMCNQYQIKATIFDKRNRIVASAYNSYEKTHPFQKEMAVKVGLPMKEYCHAEILAIIRSKGKGYRIHVERYNKAGEPRNAKPCPICEEAIKNSHIKVISYTVG